MQRRRKNRLQSDQIAARKRMTETAALGARGSSGGAAGFVVEKEGEAAIVVVRT